MIDLTGFAVLLAVVGACCYAAAARVQHSAVESTGGDGGTLRLAALWRLVRDPRWLLGLALLGAGTVLHAIAVAIGPLIVVQPVGVLALVLAAVLDARQTGQRLTGARLVPVLTATLGMGGFVAFAAGGPSAPPPAGALTGVLLTGAVAFSALAVIGTTTSTRRTTTSLRCLAFGAAGGVAYGLVSVLVRLTAHELQTGGGLDPLAVAGVLATLLGGGWCVQQAYASGRPHHVVACLTVLDPLVAVGMGVVLLGEATGTAPWVAVAELTCAAIALAGVTLLALTPQSPSHRPARTRLASPEQDRTMSSPRALRIVIGADTFPPDVNGAANFAHRLAAGLVAEGHDVHVLCPAPDPSVALLAGSQAMDGITVHHVRSHRWPFYQKFRFSVPWQANRTAGELLRELQPDVVHVQAHFVVGRALAKAAPELGIPLVATNHFMPENLFALVKMPGWLRDTAARLAWRDLVSVFGRAQVVTAPTPRAVELLQANKLGRDAQAISCGIDIEKYRRTPRTTSSTGRTVLFVGRLDEEKRVDELLRALAKLPEELAVRAEIVGDGSCRTGLEKLAETLGVRSRVTFHGHLSDAELLAAYARCDLFCMPGIAELQSLVTMEAMAAGKPVVAADAMALPHLVRPGHNGWLFPPGNVLALAARLTQTLSDPEMMATMGRASEAMIAEHAIANTLRRFEQIYRDLVTAAPAQLRQAPAPAPMAERELSRTA